MYRKINIRKASLVRIILLSMVLVNVLFAHYLIPVYNRSVDILIFGRWGMYSRGPRLTVKDITWDGGETYLYRDHRKKVKGTGINVFTMYHLLKAQEFDRVKKDYSDKLKIFCQCSEMEIHVLSGAIYEHILLKKNLEIKKRIEL